VNTVHILVLCEMSLSKSHDYLVLEQHAANSDVRSSECVISKESLRASRKLLECVDKRRMYRLESSCIQYSNIMSSRDSSSKLRSFNHEDREPKPFDDAANTLPLTPKDRRTIVFAGGCVIQSHSADDFHLSEKLDDTPGVFIVKEILLDSGTYRTMKAPIKLESFISDINFIMHNAQPGSCNDFATARLALLDLEFSRYRSYIARRQLRCTKSGL
jgi:hypothetical protein